MQAIHIKSDFFFRIKQFFKKILPCCCHPQGNLLLSPGLNCGQQHHPCLLLLISAVLVGIQTCLLVLPPVLSAQSSPVAALHAQSTYTLPCQVSVPCIGLHAQMQCLPKLSVSEPRDKTAWPIPTSCWYNDDPFLCQRISHSDCHYFCGAFLSRHALRLSQQLCIFHEVGKEATSG